MDVKEDMNTNDNKTVITSNTHINEDYLRAQCDKDKRKTKQNYQCMLAANRYASLRDDNDNNVYTHTTQYDDRDEIHRRMEENE